MKSYYDLLSTVKIKKSILRYPGGKSRAIKSILKLIPIDETLLLSPFFGGGSIEIACASLGMSVYGYDIFKPLVTFWQQLLNNKEEVLKLVKENYPISKEQFYLLQKEIMNEDNPSEQAAVFYTLNRSSFSGSTLSGGMSIGHPRFTQSSIDRLSNFNIDNLEVNLLSFVDSLSTNPQALVYLDPPYLLKKSTLYGNKGDTHRNFDHVKLAEMIKEREKWILSYNDCEEIRELYKEYTILEPSWSYCMSKSKKSNEIIIVSDYIAQKMLKK